MKTLRKPRSRAAWVDRITLPSLVVLWTACKFAGTGSAWIEAAQWMTAQGVAGLERSSLYVTMTVTCFAVLGPLLRLGGKSRLLRAVGFAAVGAPLSILLPGAGAIVFLFGVSVAAAFGADSAPATDAWPRVLARECFGVLSAGCFLSLSWQYNPHLLMRGLLVAAGLSLVAQALVLPRRSDGDRRFGVNA